MADKALIGADGKLDDQVAAHAVIGSRIATAPDAHLHAILDAGGDADLLHLLARLYPLTGAVGALLPDLLTGTVAGGADALSLHLSEEGLLSADHRTRSLAGGAGDDVARALRSGAVAVLAGDLLLDLKLLRRPLEHLVQSEVNPYAQVRSAHLTAVAAAASAKASEATKTAKASEEIAKLAEDVLHRHASATEASWTGGTVHTGVTKLVIPLALLRVAQDTIGLGRLLKLLLRTLVARIAVRVVLEGSLAVRLLDVIG